MTDEAAIDFDEAIFVESYLRHGNGARAARDAGVLPQSARQRASEMLRKDSVRAALDARRAEVLKTYKAETNRIIEEMTAIAYSRFHHYTVDPDDGQLVLAPGAPELAAAAVKRVKVKVRRTMGIATGNNPTGVILESETEFELWNKDTQLRNLAEYKKMLGAKASEAPADPDSLSIEERKERVVALFRAARQRQRAADAVKKQA